MVRGVSTYSVIGPEVVRGAELDTVIECVDVGGCQRCGRIAWRVEGAGKRTVFCKGEAEKVLRGDGRDVEIGGVE